MTWSAASTPCAVPQHCEPGRGVTVSRSVGLRFSLAYPASCLIQRPCVSRSLLVHSKMLARLCFEKVSLWLENLHWIESAKLVEALGSQQWRGVMGASADRKGSSRAASTAAQERGLLRAACRVSSSLVGLGWLPPHRRVRRRPAGRRDRNSAARERRLGERTPHGDDHGVWPAVSAL